jgi:hypothetical protein
VVLHAATIWLTGPPQHSVKTREVVRLLGKQILIGADSASLDKRWRSDELALWCLVHQADPEPWFKYFMGSTIQAALQ